MSKKEKASKGKKAKGKSKSKKAKAKAKAKDSDEDEEEEEPLPVDLKPPCILWLTDADVPVKEVLDLTRDGRKVVEIREFERAVAFVEGNPDLKSSVGFRIVVDVARHVHDDDEDDLDQTSAISGVSGVSGFSAASAVSAVSNVSSASGRRSAKKEMKAKKKKKEAPSIDGPTAIVLKLREMEWTNQVMVLEKSVDIVEDPLSDEAPVMAAPLAIPPALLSVEAVTATRDVAEVMAFCSDAKRILKPPYPTKQHLAIGHETAEANDLLSTTSRAARHLAPMKWTIFARGVGGACPSHRDRDIASVQFIFDSKLQEPNVTLESPPFEVCKTAWEDSVVRLTIRMKDVAVVPIFKELQLTKKSSTIGFEVPHNDWWGMLKRELEPEPEPPKADKERRNSGVNLDDDDDDVSVLLSGPDVADPNKGDEKKKKKKKKKKIKTAVELTKECYNKLVLSEVCLDDALTPEGFSAQTAAAWRRHKLAVDYTIKYGASTTRGDAHGRTGALCAAWGGETSANILDSYLAMDEPGIDVCDKVGLAALHVVAMSGSCALIRALLRKTSSVDLPSDMHKQTALHIAATEGRVDVIRALLEAEASPGKQDAFLRTPLHCAALAGYTEASRVLLEADPSQASTEDIEGNTPLYLAVLGGGGLPLVEALVGCEEAGLRARNSHGATPLHVAAAAGRSEMVSFMLDRQADVSVEDHGQRTPAFVAAQHGRLKCAELLLSSVEASVSGRQAELIENICSTPVDNRLFLEVEAEGGGVDWIMVAAEIDKEAGLLRLRPFDLRAFGGRWNEKTAKPQGLEPDLSTSMSSLPYAGYQTPRARKGGGTAARPATAGRTKAARPATARPLGRGARTPVLRPLTAGSARPLTGRSAALAGQSTPRRLGRTGGPQSWRDDEHAELLQSRPATASAVRRNREAEPVATPWENFLSPRPPQDYVSSSSFKQMCMTVVEREQEADRNGGVSYSKEDNEITMAIDLARAVVKETSPKGVCHVFTLDIHADDGEEVHRLRTSSREEWYAWFCMLASACSSEATRATKGKELSPPPTMQLRLDLDQLSLDQGAEVSTPPAPRATKKTSTNKVKGDVDEAIVQLDEAAGILVPFDEIEGLRPVYGQHSCVWKGSWSGRVVAVKRAINPARSLRFWEFAKQLAALSHPNIVEYIGMSAPPDLAVITEFVRGHSLHTVLHANSAPLRAGVLTSMALDVAKGVAFLHSNRVVHGNLKNTNVIADANYNCKVSDYGPAFYFPPPPLALDEVAWTLPSAIRYASPEAISTRIPSFPSDVFSLGVLVWEILARRPPFPGGRSNTNLGALLPEPDPIPPVPEEKRVPLPPIPKGKSKKVNKNGPRVSPERQALLDEYDRKVAEWEDVVAQRAASLQLPPVIDPLGTALPRIDCSVFPSFVNTPAVQVVLEILGLCLSRDAERRPVATLVEDACAQACAAVTEC